MKIFYMIIALALVVVLLKGRQRSTLRKLRESGEYPPEGSGTIEDVKRMLRKRRKIQAIKLYREIYKVDLKTAKESVEKMEIEYLEL